MRATMSSVARRGPAPSMPRPVTYDATSGTRTNTPYSEKGLSMCHGPASRPPFPPASGGAGEGRRVVLEASDGNRYEADLTPLSTVYCFPRDLAEWQRVSIDSYALALIWANRFEVHVDQVIGLATRVEPTRSTQAAS